ncbi:hypothetical protein [Microbacterium ulmi]|uniref:Uncharacterized protein n=1 Tax=Microbacterium ulmi TaxID=179095 RepID=A0A7Y2LXP3_9MICO|nr:hypothetical protein [Microbacterium ulmi]NII71371.1 hypothetical protein [Microbacterium ulmi]NNH02675.1 hypothetical protein [Microbacterium ulmi]
MGLFTPRPEEPSEWAGLPSEPDRPESTAERLPDAAPADVGLIGLLGEGVAAVESIVVPVAPEMEIAEQQETSEGPAADRP